MQQDEESEDLVSDGHCSQVFITSSKIFGFSVLLLTLLTIPLMVFLTQQKQDIRQRAQATANSKGLLPPPNRPPVVPLISGPTTETTSALNDYKIMSMDFDGQKALTILALPTMYAASDSVFQSQIDAIKAAGIDIVHIDIPWKHIEPSEGSYDFTFTKQRLEMIADRGLLIQPGIAVALNEPQWFRDKYPDADFVSEEGKKVRDYHGGSIAV